jgi:hypothetical protein
VAGLQGNGEENEADAEADAGFTRAPSPNIDFLVQYRRSHPMSG